jgi:hypothetical protein
MAKQILNKCGGLPKVISAMGCFLAKNLNWEATNNNFMNQLENNPELVASVHSLFRWLDSYFHNCPDELKPCIFYLSIFPRRHSIRRRRLVRRWIAEGYARDTDDNLAELNGEHYFSRLVNLSMLTDDERGVDMAGSGSVRRMAKCNVNDFFHEYILSRRMEENHVFALEGRCSQPTRRTGRHLVIEERRPERVQQDRVLAAEVADGVRAVETVLRLRQDEGASGAGSGGHGRSD